MPEVSVMIPAFNRSGFLSEAIKSCFAQTYTDIEVVVVDDGSTEDLEQMVRHLGEHIDAQARLRYVRQPHLGANAARNRGLRESKGEFVQFLDSDDLLHPAKLEVQRNILRDEPALDMVFGLDEYFRDSPGDSRLLWNLSDARDHLDRFLWGDGVWHTGSPLWRSRALARIGPWNEKLICWQDWEFHVRALCRGITYTCVPMVLAHLRIHDQVRSLNLEPLQVREQSRLEAALAVAAELRKASLWTPGRGDALAVFLLSIAEDFAAVGEWRSARFALEKASDFAGDSRMRLVVLFVTAAMRFSQLTTVSHPNLTLATHRLMYVLRLQPRRACTRGIMSVSDAKIENGPISRLFMQHSLPGNGSREPTVVQSNFNGASQG